MQPASIEDDLFGVTADGIPVERYTLRNPHGSQARIITFGATLTELWMSDGQRQFQDMVLGFDDLKSYETVSPYFGCTVGRVAFRIAAGRFTLDGQDYQLTLNAGRHHLHGGLRGFSKAVWRARPQPDPQSPGLQLTLVSPDGDEGYPGALEATVTYTLTGDNQLRIDYQATADRPTPVNLTNHTYFNLGGEDSGNVLGHMLQLGARRFSPADATMTPTGELLAVDGTPLDFSTPQRLGARIGQPPAQDGYDLAYPLDQPGDLGASAARLADPRSGRTMEVRTTQPAIILYTGNALDGTLRGKRGTVYGKHAGVCLETGHLPGSVQHPHFPSIILRPGETYRHTCIYRFAAMA